MLKNLREYNISIKTKFLLTSNLKLTGIKLLSRGPRTLPQTITRLSCLKLSVVAAVTPLKCRLHLLLLGLFAGPMNFARVRPSLGVHFSKFKLLFYNYFNQNTGGVARVQTVQAKEKICRLESTSRR